MALTPTAAFSITLDCRLDNLPGTLGRLCSAIGEAGGNIGALDGFDVRGDVGHRSAVAGVCRRRVRADVERAGARGKGAGRARVPAG